MSIKFDKNGNIANQKVNYIIKHDGYTKAMIQESKEWFIDIIQAKRLILRSIKKLKNKSN